ncbi:MAG: rod shape-determining protein RodA [Candidatus Electryonea clarkiae]|nr:rod shape-determining protein RodA [Candidatus Electryonea clarkiae]MDP8288121.1 rod shape-determining protein RodA [Candidatus Electryonea clarkiae]
MRLRRLEIEWIVPLVTILLISVGMVALYSASKASGGGFFERQLIYLAIGLVFAVTLALMPDRITFAFSYIGYVFILLLLVLVLMVGTGPTGRWIGLGTFHIQPSELGKLAVIIALARFFSDRRTDLRKFKNIFLMAQIAIIPFGLILIEPDLGTSLVIPVITGMIAYWAGFPYLALVLAVSPIAVMIASINPYALVVVIGIALVLGYFTGIRLHLAMLWGVALGIIGWLTPRLWDHLKPYQRQRLMTFVNPEADPLGSGYQIIQSKVAVGSGEFWGKGFLNGSQTHRGFLPEQHTDFIFSVIGEEFGFAGATIVLILFWILIVRLFILARKTKSPFSSLCIVGIASTISLQVVVNVGMTIGIMPVTGLPLPLLSYGGSSLLTTMAALGLATGMGTRYRGS